jgi:putative glutamine amidotransferase
MRPVVLVSCDRRDQTGYRPGPRVRPLRPEVWTGEATILAVRAAGGVPVLAPPGEDDVAALLSTCQAVVLTGGHFDIHPSLYGEAVTGRLDRVEPGRTSLELELAQQAYLRGIPLLGLCGGMQAMAVARRGRLIQDLPTPLDLDPSPIAHEQPTDPATAWHTVRTQAPATAILGDTTPVNSTHHQAVRDPGEGLVACGWSEDGVIEVIAAPDRFFFGVQWHPELLGDLRPFTALLAAIGSQSATPPSRP